MQQVHQHTPRVARPKPSLLPSNPAPLSNDDPNILNTSSTTSLPKIEKIDAKGAVSITLQAHKREKRPDEITQVATPPDSRASKKIFAKWFKELGKKKKVASIISDHKTAGLALLKNLKPGSDTTEALDNWAARLVKRSKTNEKLMENPPPRTVRRYPG